MCAHRRFYNFCHKNKGQDGFLTKEEAVKLAEETGVWEPRDEEVLEQLIKNLKKLKSERHQFKYQSRQLARVDQYIKVTEEEMVKLNKRKNTFLPQTIEYQAQYDLYSYLLAICLHNDREQRVWPDWETFEEETDADLVNNLIRIIFYQGIFLDKDIREVARSEPWRTRWRTAHKIGFKLFDEECFGYPQFQLAYWSNMYDSVFESIDCPTRDIIEDNEALDQWFEEQGEKFEERAKERGKEETGPRIKNPKIANAQEVFVKVDSAEDARKVYSELNTPQARKIIKRRQDYLTKKGGYAKEQEMPDTIENIRMQMTQMGRDEVKRRAKGISRK